jgi:hypothetical protein
MTQTPVAFAGQVALCHFLRLYSRDGQGGLRAVQYAFQNFHFGETITKRQQPYLFIPFGFSGVSTSKSGDVEPASLVFPNDDQGLSRTIISEALRGEDINIEDPERILLPYIAQVEVVLINIDTNEERTLYTYTGVCSSANWNDTEAVLELGGVLDAVEGDIPTRTLRRDLVGNLPTTPTVRIR